LICRRLIQHWLNSALASIGFSEVASFGRMAAGWLPLGSIDELAAIAGVNFARASFGGITQAGVVQTQGDASQRTDDVRNVFGFTGLGTTVGVISDSYNTAPGVTIRAADDIGSGDLPIGVNVLDDTYPVSIPDNEPIDEGRAMLQIVHDVAPDAALAFHTSGVAQAAMRNAILDLQAAGADVIVDDIIFLAEPMFQDGIIAQAVDQVVNAGVTYVSAAGNQGRRSYQSGFIAGPVLNISGTLETSHLFNAGTGDNRQRITIPTNSTFITSFQWDAPFATASTTGAGANNNLNIYLLNGNTIVAQGRTNNVGGDAVEVFGFTNTTAVTQYDILITSAAGPLPGTIKYVDFSSPNVVFNEHLTNSSTLYAHANAEGAIAVGAAAYFNTPEAGVTPPVVEGFSALAGTPIIFDTAGNRLATPIVRAKTDIVAPDGVNTTFFDEDIPNDPDTRPNFFGTSAAAPHVAALAALMLDANPTLTPADVEVSLEQTAIDMDDPVPAGFQTGFDVATGSGLVNGVSAVYDIFTPSTPFLDPNSDSGQFNDDEITNVTTPLIKGTVPANSFVRLYVDGVERGTQQLGSGDTEFEITPSVALTPGTHSITVRVAESSAVPLVNMSNLSGTLTVVIDTTAAAPSTPNLLDADDSGVSNTDDKTRITMPRFTGTAEAGATVTLLEGTTVLGSGTATAGGGWTIQSTALSESVHNIKARVTDLAGNVSSDSATLAMTVDTTPVKVTDVKLWGTGWTGLGPISFASRVATGCDRLCRAAEPAVAAHRDAERQSDTDPVQRKRGQTRQERD
jgi:hypothetical protein